MKVSSLIDSLRSNFLNHYRDNFVQKRYDGKNKSQILADYETQLTFVLFEKALKELESKGLDTEVTPDILQIVLKDLNDRWCKRIKNTDLCYSIALQNVANQLCLGIAKFVAGLPGSPQPHHHYPLLMTTIKSWHDERSHSNILNKALHEFIVSDDANFIICLEYLRSEYIQKIIKGERLPFRLYFYMKLADKNDDIELSHGEAVRVVLHSDVMSKYYQAVVTKHQKSKALEDSKANSNHQMHVKEAQLNKIKQEEQDLRKEMIIAIRDDKYLNNKIASTHGEEGVRRLQDNLLNYVNDMFVTRDQLFEYVFHLVRRDQWNDFVNRFDFDVLINLLSPKAKSIDDVLADTTLFSDENNERYGRFISFCLIKAYWNKRAKGEEYDTYAARIFGANKRVSKEEKQKVVKLLLDAIEADAPISMENIHAEAVKRDIVTALVSDTVGEIYKRMCEIHRPVVMENRVSITVTAESRVGL